MLAEYLRRGWRKLCQIFSGRPAWGPVWGENPPTIVGVCRECGAVVLRGWHLKVENGYLCQRCAGRKGLRPAKP